MCDVRDNPRWALSHVDDMLDILENHADECDMKRILRGYDIISYLQIMKVRCLWKKGVV